MGCQLAGQPGSRFPSPPHTSFVWQSASRFGETDFSFFWRRLEQEEEAAGEEGAEKEDRGDGARIVEEECGERSPAGRRQAVVPSGIGFGNPRDLRAKPYGHQE